MEVLSDFEDLLSALNRENVRYLVVGAHAFGHHVEPRYTKDLDVWVEATPENAVRVWKALARFGAPLAGVTEADFANSTMVYQMGVPPCRVDILMGIDGTTFPTAWRRRVRRRYGAVPVSVLGLEDLIKTKRAANRPQDQVDLEWLLQERTRRRSRRRADGHGRRRCSTRPPT